MSLDMLFISARSLYVPKMSSPGAGIWVTSEGVAGVTGDPPGETGVWSGFAMVVSAWLLSTQPNVKADIAIMINIYTHFIFYLLYSVSVRVVVTPPVTFSSLLLLAFPLFTTSFLRSLTNWIS